MIMIAAESDPTGRRGPNAHNCAGTLTRTRNGTICADAKYACASVLEVPALLCGDYGD